MLWFILWEHSELLWFKQPLLVCAFVWHGELLTSLWVIPSGQHFLDTGFADKHYLPANKTRENIIIWQADSEYPELILRHNSCARFFSITQYPTLCVEECPAGVSPWGIASRCVRWGRYQNGEINIITNRWSFIAWHSGLALSGFSWCSGGCLGSINHRPTSISYCEVSWYFHHHRLVGGTEEGRRMSRRCFIKHVLWVLWWEEE